MLGLRGSRYWTAFGWSLLANVAVWVGVLALVWSRGISLVPYVPTLTYEQLPYRMDAGGIALDRPVDLSGPIPRGASLTYRGWHASGVGNVESWIVVTFDAERQSGYKVVSDGVRCTLSSAPDLCELKAAGRTILTESRMDDTQQHVQFALALERALGGR